MKKKIPEQFSRFAKKKNNAAIKEEFKQEKRKWKKEREEFFEKKRNESGVRSQEFGVRSSGTEKKFNQERASHSPLPTHHVAQMPLNKYMAHCGICSRRDAAALIENGKVKVNG